MADTNAPQQQTYNVVPGNGAATAALVLAIVGLVFGLVPFTGFIAVICGALAILFGFMGRRKLKRNETPKGKGSSLAGLIIGAIALALGVWGITIVFGAVDQFDQDMQEIFSDLDDI